MKIDGYGTEDSSKKAHLDWDKNIETATKFIQRVSKECIEGLSIKLAGKHEGKKMLVEVSYRPPDNKKMGTHAFPVSLHQNANEFELQLSKVFSNYHSAAKRINDMDLLSIFL